MNFWLMKSEPNNYSIDDLQSDGFSHWEGIRNYQARNYMRDKMEIGDLVLFYHSNVLVPGVSGICRVCSAPFPDHTSWDITSKYYDQRSSPEKPIWYMVEVEFVEKFPHFVTLDELRKHHDLKHMMVLKRGRRLSIQPITRHDFEVIRSIGFQTAVLNHES